MRDTRQNVISLTDIHVHAIARIVSFDNGCAFKDKENIAYISMPVPRDTFVAHKAHSRHLHVRSNCYMLQAVRALISLRPGPARKVERCRTCSWPSRRHEGKSRRSSDGS